MKSWSTISQILQWQSGLLNVKGNINIETPSIKNYCLFPNQAAYLVDCQTGSIVESTGNFNALFGYSHFQLQNVEQLYEPVVHSNRQEVLQMTWRVLDWIFNQAHGSERQNGALFKYHVRQRGGRYVKILRHTLAWAKVNGKITHTLGVLTNIQNLDNSLYPSVSVFGPGEEYFHSALQGNLNGVDLFTPQELRILKMLAEGRTSRWIANYLHLSVHTIDTHRRNMIRKAEAENTGELLYITRNLGLLNY